MMSYDGGLVEVVVDVGHECGGLALAEGTRVEDRVARAGARKRLGASAVDVVGVAEFFGELEGLWRESGRGRRGVTRGLSR